MCYQARGTVFRGACEAFEGKLFGIKRVSDFEENRSGSSVRSSRRKTVREKACDALEGELSIKERVW